MIVLVDNSVRLNLGYHTSCEPYRLCSVALREMRLMEERPRSYGDQGAADEACVVGLKHRGVAGIRAVPRSKRNALPSGGEFQFQRSLNSPLWRCDGAPEGIRTPDLCLRRAALYPAELRAQSAFDPAYIAKACICGNCSEVGSRRRYGWLRAAVACRRHRA
jgi:hypothetical protein